MHLIPWDRPANHENPREMLVLPLVLCLYIHFSVRTDNLSHLYCTCIVCFISSFIYLCTFTVPFFCFISIAILIVFSCTLFVMLFLYSFLFLLDVNLYFYLKLIPLYNHCMPCVLYLYPFLYTHCIVLFCCLYLYSYHYCFFFPLYLILFHFILNLDSWWLLLLLSLIFHFHFDFCYWVSSVFSCFHCDPISYYFYVITFLFPESPPTPSVWLTL